MIRGEHLQMMNQNTQAVPFYQHSGFSLLEEVPVDTSRAGLYHTKVLAFGRRLE